jgi:hypothetical protein
MATGSVTHKDGIEAVGTNVIDCVNGKAFVVGTQGDSEKVTVHIRDVSGELVIGKTFLKRKFSERAASFFDVVK